MMIHRIYQSQDPLTVRDQWDSGPIEIPRELHSHLLRATVARRTTTTPQYWASAETLVGIEFFVKYAPWDKARYGEIAEPTAEAEALHATYDNGEWHPAGAGGRWCGDVIRRGDLFNLQRQLCARGSGEEIAVTDLNSTLPRHASHVSMRISVAGPALVTAVELLLGR